jgi:hypothetical protein
MNFMHLFGAMNHFTNQNFCRKKYLVLIYYWFEETRFYPKGAQSRGREACKVDLEEET